MTTKRELALLREGFESALAALAGPGSRILLAVSGGSDSTGLMHLAARSAERTSLSFAVGFVDHGLRSGVAAERALVQEQATGLGLPFFEARVNEGELAKARTIASLQQWARSQRYSLLADLAARAGCGAVATGHTQDDQAETVLIRALRGTGIDGLSGILARRALGETGIFLIRPLLCATRAELRGFLADCGASWSEDPSNTNRRFLRARVRNELMPLIDELYKGAAGRVAALAAEAHAVAEAVDEQVVARTAPFEPLRLAQGVRLRRVSVEALPEALWGRAVRRALEQVQGNLRRFERTHVEAILAPMRSRSSTSALPLPGPGQFWVCYGDLYAFAEPLPEVPRQNCALNSRFLSQDAELEALGAKVEVCATTQEALGGLELRLRASGDRLGGTLAKLKESIGRARIPRIYRDYLPVLARGSVVVDAPWLAEPRALGVTVKWRFADFSPLRDIEPEGGWRNRFD